MRRFGSRGSRRAVHAIDATGCAAAGTTVEGADATDSADVDAADVCALTVESGGAGSVAAIAVGDPVATSGWRPVARCFTSNTSPTTPRTTTPSNAPISSCCPDDLESNSLHTHRSTHLALAMLGRRALGLCLVWKVMGVSRGARLTDRRGHPPSAIAQHRIRMRRPGASIFPASWAHHAWLSAARPAAPIPP